MSTLETGHEQLASNPDGDGVSASHTSTSSAAAARAAVLASLHGENSYLDQQLDMLQLQVDSWQPRRKPDYALLYNSMRQLHDFPHDVVQPKEDLVYQCLMQRDADEAEEFAGIRSQHERIHELSSRLLRQLSDISHGVKTARRDRLRPQLQRFIDAFRQHIDAEENAVFPTAEKQLLDSDWYALQTGISYLESVHSDDKLTVTESDDQAFVTRATPVRRSVTHHLSARSERLAASFSMAQLLGAYSIAETIGSFNESMEQLTKLGIKQTKTGLNASLDEIMACRDTSSGLADLPGKLLRTTLDNVSDTFSEARQIVKKTWQRDQPVSSRVGLLQDTWRGGQTPRLHH